MPQAVRGRTSRRHAMLFYCNSGWWLVFLLPHFGIQSVGSSSRPVASPRPLADPPLGESPSISTPQHTEYAGTSQANPIPISIPICPRSTTLLTVLFLHVWRGRRCPFAQLPRPPCRASDHTLSGCGDWSRSLKGRFETIRQMTVQSILYVVSSRDRPGKSQRSAPTWWKGKWGEPVWDGQAGLGWVML
ncbi:hypothetical protein BJ875DRAFT_227285 [Amylocarpus encephaloides]|uniref:Uncharacterized protein n=1 Tax=Amylocarpus encephaloides TaxID=45428 RepID=A0A9P7YMR2_9HELO|nr:hypothetical protein BJ875DRAFT_227285 [Amylocarpus encephaloides]